MFNSKETALKAIQELELKYDALRMRYNDLEMDYKKKQLDCELRGAQQNAEYECQWHTEREKKNTELALIDAKIEERKKYLAVHDEHLTALGMICKELVLALKAKQ